MQLVFPNILEVTEYGQFLGIKQLYVDNFDFFGKNLWHPEQQLGNTYYLFYGQGTDCQIIM